MRPTFVAEVQTRRDDRDARVPRILLHVSKDIDSRVLRAYALRLQAEIEEIAAKDSPWSSHLDFGGTAHTIYGAVELRTYGGTDAECDQGLELLRRAAASVNRPRR